MSVKRVSFELMFNTKRILSVPGNEKRRALGTKYKTGTCLPFIYVYTCLLTIIAALSFYRICACTHICMILFSSIHPFHIMNTLMIYFVQRFVFFHYNALTLKLFSFSFFILVLQKLHDTVVFCCIYVNTKQSSFTFICINKLTEKNIAKEWN